MDKNQIFTLIGILFYTLSLSVSIFMNLPKKINLLFEFKYVFILSFLLLFSIYVYPLSFFYLSGDEPAGDISPDIYIFGAYIPISLFLSGIFILIFSFLFKKWNSISIIKNNDKILLANFDKLILYILIIICFLLLIELSKSAGGLFLLILKGYTVTELFVGNGQYAIAFEWLTTISLLFFSNALLKRNKFLIAINILILVLLILIFTIMGRRAVIVLILGSALMCYNLLYAQIRPLFIIGLVSVAFIFLTYVGFLRGESFENVGEGIESIAAKNERYSNEEDLDMFYTLKTGNFAVPFETLPKIISEAGERFNFGFGYYSLSSTLNIIPTFIWNNRPIPLSSWYVKVFYDITNLNEGRQFFILTASYMDFGPFGILLFAILLAFFFSKLNYMYSNNSKNVLIVTLISIFFGSLMNMISNDFLGFFIGFFKGYAFPIAAIFLFKKIVKIALLK